MATYTSHLNLKLPDYSDVADVKDLNDNFKKIDDAIASGGTGGGTGGITQETDPTVPSWAKQPNKPTYTAAEVGALPNTTVIPTVPTTLPNPQPIVINGVSYDGSEKKEITIQAEDGGIVTETDPTVPAWAKAANKPTYTADEVGALPNTYEAPVKSVNGKTGAVTLAASDVGALPNTTVIPTVPTALKNPYPITINGVEYDGSEAKTITIQAADGGESVSLDTTLTQYGMAADAGATGNAIAQETAAREQAVNELNEAIDNKLPSDGTAADSSKLSGKEAGEYTLKSDLWKRVHNTTGAIRNMLSIAASYFPHKDEFVYGNWNTAVNTNCTQVDGKWEIDCSSFVSLVLMGVPYEGSRYNGHTQNVGHPGYVFDVFEPTSAGRPYGWLASKLAQYAEENGYFYTLDGNIDSVMPGDIIFVNNSVEGTYLDIGHCAIALSVDKKEDYITCLEVAEDTFAIKNWLIGDGKAAYAARFPLIDCDCPSEEDFVKTDSITFPMAVQKTISANAVSIGVDYIPLTKEFSEYDILTMVIRMDTPLPDGCQFALGATISGTFKAFNKIGDAYAENLYAFTFMLPEGFTQDVVNKNPVIQLRISAGTGNAETVIDATIASINVYEGYVRPAWMEGNVVGSGSEYTLPVATETALGGVKAPAATDDMTQQVGVKEDGTMWVPKGGSGLGEYAGDLLASGTIDVTDYATNTRIETGVTLAKLREYKRVRLSFKASANKGIGYFFIKIANKSFMRDSSLIGMILDMEWADDSKNTIQLMRWGGNSAYMTGSVMADIMTYGQDERNSQLSIMPAMLNVAGVSETETIYFSNVGNIADSTTYPWWIYGVIK